MGLVDIFNSVGHILSFALDPLLKLPPVWSIMILAFMISLFITLIYKLVTDQHLMKSLKEDLKKHQEEMKKHKHDPEKVIKIQKKAMEKNMQYMMHSFKPTLFTFIPIILIFGWANTHIGYEPITPESIFTTTLQFDADATGFVTINPPIGIQVIGERTKSVNATVNFAMKGKQGEYIIEYLFDNRTYEQEIIITTNKEYKRPVKVIKGSELKVIKTNLTPIHPFGNFSLFGWQPGWLAAYIFFSLIFSMGLRKIMKLH